MEQDKRDALMELYNAGQRIDDMRADGMVISDLIADGYIFDWSRQYPSIDIYALTNKGRSYLDGYCKGKTDAKSGTVRPKRTYPSALVEMLMYGEEYTSEQLLTDPSFAQGLFDLMYNGLVDCRHVTVNKKQELYYKSTPLMNEFCEGYAEGRR